MVTIGSQWLPLVLRGYHWFSVVFNGSQWFPEVTRGFQWLSVVLNSYHWFSVVLGGSRWFSVVMVLNGEIHDATNHRSTKTQNPEVQKLHTQREQCQVSKEFAVYMTLPLVTYIHHT